MQITFTLETDSRMAAQDVRDRLATVIPDLPDAADAPQVVRYNPLDDPVLSLAISSDSLSSGALTRLTRDVIAPALTAVEGVGSATPIGATDGQVDVLLDPDRMRAHGLGIADVLEAIRDENRLAPAGTVESGATALPAQLNAEARSEADLAELIIARPGGAAVRLSEIARVQRGIADPESLAFRDGRGALAVDVVKVDGANTVAVAEGALRAIEALTESSTLGDARIEVLLNSATEIEAIYHTVQSTLIEGMVLAVLIVFLFLNSWRSAPHGTGL